VLKKLICIFGLDFKAIYHTTNGRAKMEESHLDVIILSDIIHSIAEENSKTRQKVHEFI
jgi:hypothetical protein